MQRSLHVWRYLIFFYHATWYRLASIARSRSYDLRAICVLANWISLFELLPSRKKRGVRWISWFAYLLREITKYWCKRFSGICDLCKCNTSWGSLEHAATYTSWHVRYILMTIFNFFFFFLATWYQVLCGAILAEVHLEHVATDIHQLIFDVYFLNDNIWLLFSCNMALRPSRNEYTANVLY